MIEKAPQLHTHESVRKVFLKDLTFSASIGAYDEERTRPQKVVVSVQVDVVDPDDPVSENLEDVLCYHKLAKRIGEIIDNGHIVLVETLAERIAELVLASPLALGVHIVVEKPDAIENAASVGVEIYRSKA